MQEVDGRSVVVRYADGRLLKGTTHDFQAVKPEFHVYPGGDEKQRAVAVAFPELKAVFFVRTYDGNPKHRATTLFEGPVQGRKMLVTFKDGEVIAGTTVGYNTKAQGFFLMPVDAQGNNVRIYVINSAVKEVRWA